MHDIDNVKKRIITSMIAILLLIFALFGITYAYFTAKVKGNTNDKSVDVSAGKLELVYGDGNGFIKVDKIQPGEVIKSKTFTVKNTGTGDIDSYEVILENVINELKYYNDLTYELKCNSDIGTCVGSNDVFPIYDNSIVVNSIKVGETHTYTLTLTYHETNLDQSDDMDKNIEAKVNIRDSEFNYTKLNIYGSSEGLGTLVNEETNRFNGKYKVDIKSIGKNLFNKDDNIAFIWSGGQVSTTVYGKQSIYAEVKPNTKYTISRKNLTGEKFVIACLDSFPIEGLKNSENTTVTVADDKSDVTIITGNKTSYIFAWVYNGQNASHDYTFEEGLNSIQIEVGENATNYEPYEEIKYSIYIEEPLRCIDSACDYVDLVNKKVIRKIKNDNGTLSVLDTPTEEKIQAIDTDILTNRTIVVEGATNVEQELDR